MSGNLAFYFYTASLDLHAQDAQVFIADFATSGHVAASADTFKMKGSDVFHEVEDTQIPAAVLKRHGANGAEAAFSPTATQTLLRAAARVVFLNG